MIIEVRDPAEVSERLATLHDSASTSVARLAEQSGTPLDTLAAIKFSPIGFHPLEDRPLNLVEQVNQTFTYYVALKAALLLMEWHPQAEGFRLAPGAHAPRGSLDVESLVQGYVGAETFAAVDPNNNQKIKKDLDKLAQRPETYRYSFFMSPKYPETARVPKFERGGILVYSIGMDE